MIGVIDRSYQQRVLKFIPILLTTSFSPLCGVELIELWTQQWGLGSAGPETNKPLISKLEPEPPLPTSLPVMFIFNFYYFDFYLILINYLIIYLLYCCA